MGTATRRAVNCRSLHRSLCRSLHRYTYRYRHQASLAAKMLLRSTVVTQASGWPLWYEPLLRDLEHVVVVRPDLSDLIERLAWLRRNDARARAIGERGARWIGSLLRERSVVLYVRRILERYRSLFPPQSPPRLGEIVSVARI